MNEVPRKIEGPKTGRLSCSPLKVLVCEFLALALSVIRCTDRKQEGFKSPSGSKLWPLFLDLWTAIAIYFTVHSTAAASMRRTRAAEENAVLPFRGEGVVLNETDDLVVAGRKRNFQYISARRDAHGFPHPSQDGV